MHWLDKEPEFGLYWRTKSSRQQVLWGKWWQDRVGGIGMTGAAEDTQGVVSYPTSVPPVCQQLQAELFG